MSTEDLERVEAGPRHRWQFGRFTVSRYANGKWDVSDGCLGTGNHRTPAGAFVALLRWRREHAQMPIARRIPED